MYAKAGLLCEDKLAAFERSILVLPRKSWLKHVRIRDSMVAVARMPVASTTKEKPVIPTAVAAGFCLSPSLRRGGRHGVEESLSRF